MLDTQNVLCRKELRRKPVLKGEVQNASLDMLNLRLPLIQKLVELQANYSWVLTTLQLVVSLTCASQSSKHFTWVIPFIPCNSSVKLGMIIVKKTRHSKVK